MDLLDYRLRDVLKAYIAKCVFVRHALRSVCRRFRAMFPVEETFLRLMLFLSDPEKHSFGYVFEPGLFGFGTSNAAYDECRSDKVIMLYVLFPSIQTMPNLEDLRSKISNDENHIEATVRPPQFPVRHNSYARRNQRDCVKVTIIGRSRAHLYDVEMDVDVRLDEDVLRRLMEGGHRLSLSFDILCQRVCTVFGCNCSSIEDLNVPKASWTAWLESGRRLFMVSHAPTRIRIKKEQGISLDT
jgi:hypothetical protein